MKLMRERGMASHGQSIIKHLGLTSGFHTTKQKRFDLRERETLWKGTVFRQPEYTA
jgi:hypothetical protein